MGMLRNILTNIPNRSCKCLTCLNGKTVLITGGNSGIGFQTAKILASRGAKVIIADKNLTNAPKNEIITATNNTNVHLYHLDLASLQSIRKFAKFINKTEQKLDILINNAGVGGLIHQYTSDFLQKEMQINHFGPFLLTHLLIDLLKKSARSRIIFVSSILAFINNLTLENLNNKSKFPISDFLVYSNSKLCNIITSVGFAEKLEGTEVTSNAVHPGITVTNLYKGMRGHDALKLTKKLIYAGLNLVAKDPLQGAQTLLHVAISNKLGNTTGKFFMECKQVDPPLKISDKEFCKQIWNASEDLVKLVEEEKLKKAYVLGSNAPHKLI